MTDDELITAMRAGDRRAGNLLAQRYYRDLNLYYRKRMPPDEADELTQVALLESVGRIDRFRGESSFRHYVFAIARHVLSDRQRRVGRRIETLPASTSDAPDDQTSPSERMDRAELLEQVHAAVESLEDHYHDVLTLKLDGASNYEIAEELDVPQNTVRSRLSRALERVRIALGDRLDEFFRAHPPAAPRASSS